MGLLFRIFRETERIVAIDACGPYLELVKSTGTHGGVMKLGPSKSQADIDDSIVMGDTVTDVERKLVRSMIGKGSKILSANGLLPKGERLIVGENTTVML